MLRVNLLRLGDEFLVPAGVPGLIAADEKQRHAAWVEGKQNSVGTTLVLNSQFLTFTIFEPVSVSA